MDDERIIGLFFSRDERAVQEMEKKYGAYCMTIAKNILGNAEDSEECVSDTYLAVWNSIPPKVPEKLSLYLGKITRNLSLNRFRKNNAEKRGEGEICSVLDELAEVVSGEEDVEKTFERKEVIAAVNNFLKTLPEEKRSIFICRYWYFDSVEEIARRFGKKESSVYSILERIRKKLEKYLEERGFDL